MGDKTNFWVRKAHRWLGLAIGMQLLLWTVSGLYFSLIPIETVRGEDRVYEAEPVNFAHTPLLSPQQVINTLIKREGHSLQVRKLELRRVLGTPVYEIRYQVGAEAKIQLANATDGELWPALTRVAARRNSTWRVFDFLWMLHIMDFENRDDFNTFLLQLISILGVITIISGFVLWAMTTSLFRSRQA